MLSCPIPDFLITRLLEADIVHSRPEAGSNEFSPASGVGGELIDSRKSGFSRSGCSSRICSKVISAPSQPRTSQTVIRRPRTQGFPLRLPGSIVILLVLAAGFEKPDCNLNYALERLTA